MAAPPSKPAPSGSVSPSENIVVLKDPPPAAGDVTEGETTETVLPSYSDSKSSDHYTVAQTLLNEGDFENAMTTIEEGIGLTREKLSSLSDDDIAVHPAMAPFHYLYGSTLLYSLEESQSAMQIPSATEAGGEQDLDDLQIAFENLDAARYIMETSLKADAESWTPSMALDLAKVYLREGDLGRTNGNYTSALSDYQNCLALREKHLGPFDRQIADVHYQLALVYSLAVVDTTSSSASAENPTGNSAVAASTSTSPVGEATKELHRQKSAEHFLECCRALSGQVATLCGHADPPGLLQDAIQNLPGKTIGEEETGGDNVALHRLRIANLRAKTAELELPKDEPGLIVRDLLSLLEEIQETVDNMQESEEGVQQMTQLKQEITAAVAAQPGDDADDAKLPASTTTTDPNSSTEGVTTIGFGPSSLPASVETATAAQPVMMVRKKKRKADDAKLPPAAE